MDERVTNLILSLEQATQMAKQLPQITDPSQTLQIYSTLHSAHYHLSSFLSTTALPPLPQPSLSSSGSDDASPMVLENDEVNNIAVDGVEERMRDFFIRNKRQKRALSPSTVVAGEKQRRETQFGKDDEIEYDPNVTRLKALELIHQFHC